MNITPNLVNWEEILDPPPHKIFVWDSYGHYQDCLFPNPAQGHFLGGETIKGKHLEEVLSSTEAEIVWGGISKALETQDPITRDMEWSTPKGKIYTVIRFFPIGKLVIGVVNDQPLVDG